MEGEAEAWGRAKPAPEEAGDALAAGLRISRCMESPRRTTNQHCQQKPVHMTFPPEVSELFFPKLKSSQDAHRARPHSRPCCISS